MNGKTFVITEQNVGSYVQSIAHWMKTKVQDAHRKGIVLGMSGGVDCSVAARLGQVANIPVHLVLMPYGDDMKNSNSHAHAMEFIEKFDFPYHIKDIKPAVDSAAIDDEALIKLSTTFGFLPDDTDSNMVLANANLRPRERMQYLYGVAQAFSCFVCGTGNMSERLVGYFTKWGDGAYDINPLGFLTKREVYLLAKFLGVPDSIINKKPSAGLWEGQTDEDELGMTYFQIDEYILNGTSGSSEIDALIERRILLSRHKFDELLIFKG